jgi:hypothetical protein
VRRPDLLTGMRDSLGRRLIEPESCVSSSCVGGSILESQKSTGPGSFLAKTHNQVGTLRFENPGFAPARPALYFWFRLPGYVPEN